ncbi:MULTISPECIES: putative ABC transporter permease subunit [Clostridium]|uniref:putative ABC transporter permease subunit n=1 Tax=Clostridium TaxID=1485 RepID=UPI0008260265|nr:MULTISPECIES: PH domain-containing protein [Clostridium]
MKKFLALIKVLLKNSGSTLSGMNTKKRSLSFLILAIIFIPIVVGLTAVFMKSYDIILKYNLQDLMFSQLFGASSIAMIILGIFYVVSTYYFADDVAFFITMPIEPYKVLGAKFVTAMIYQYFIELILLMPCIIGFGMKMGTPLYWVYSLVIYIVLPVIPTVICSLISIVIMAFSKFFRNKDRLKIIAGILAIVFSISLSIVIQYFSGYSGNSTNILKNGKVVGKVSNAFFISNFASDAIKNINSGKGLLGILVFIFISAIAVGIFLLMAEGLYLKGVVGLTESSSSGKKLSLGEVYRQSNRKSKLKASILNEWRNLYRTPAYLLNCVIVAVIFTPFMTGIFAFSYWQMGSVPSGFSDNPLYISVVSAIAINLCIFNLAAPTSISREGKSFFIGRYIPVSYKTQIMAKVIVGTLMSYFSLILCLLTAAVFMKLKLITVAMVVFISVFGIAAFNTFGVFIDIYFPKLYWDDETKAVKQNFNVGIQMLVSIFIYGFMVFVSYRLKLDTYSNFIFLLTCNILLFVSFAVLLLKNGIKQFAVSSNYIEGEGDENKDKKKNYKIIRVIIITIFISIFAVFMLVEKTTEAKIVISPNKAYIKSGMESTEFNLKDITKVYIKSTIPHSSKVMGFGWGSEKRGKFNVDGMGKGNIYVQSDSGKFIYIKLKDGFVIINYKDSNKTEEVYKKIKKLYH